jgi:hypothetical protein
MTRDPNEKPSIFNRPYEDDAPPPLDVDENAGEPPTRAADAPAARPIPQPRGAPASYGDPQYGDAQYGDPSSRAPDRRRTLAIAGAGLVLLAVAGFIGVSLLREPSPAGAVPSATASAEGSGAPIASASAEPVPSDTPTPVPTPAGPPNELAVGGWATVAADQLSVRQEPGPESQSANELMNGAIVHVDEGPTEIEGANWYRVTSLGGASGWASSGLESEPEVEMLTSDPQLNECGQVRGPVFNTSGPLAPNDPLRIGAFTLPAAAFDDRALAGMELIRGMGDEACFTARMLTDGTAELSTELSVSACGHADPYGTLYQLVPTDSPQVSLASRVIEPTLIHPVLLDGGPPDNRMSSNLQTVLTMIANEGSSGCVTTSVIQRGDAVESQRSVMAHQCSTVEQYDQFSLKLAPVAGGPTAWLKSDGNDYDNRFRAGQRAMVSVDAGAADQSRYMYAWPQDEC